MDRGAIDDLRDVRCVSGREVSKLLALQQLRRQAIADVRSWFVETCRADSGTSRATLIQVLTDVQRDLGEGEHWAVSYEPRAARTTISWPWGARTHLYDRAFMRSLWGSFFSAKTQPELGWDLLAQIAR